MMREAGFWTKPTVTHVVGTFVLSAIVTTITAVLNELELSNIMSLQQEVLSTPYLLSNSTEVKVVVHIKKELSRVRVMAPLGSARVRVSAADNNLEMGSSTRAFVPECNTRTLCFLYPVFKCKPRRLDVSK